MLKIEKELIWKQKFAEIRKLNGGVRCYLDTPYLTTFLIELMNYK